MPTLASAAVASIQRHPEHSRSMFASLLEESSRTLWPRTVQTAGLVVHDTTLGGRPTSAPVVNGRREAIRLGPVHSSATGACRGHRPRVRRQQAAGRPARFHRPPRRLLHAPPPVCAHAALGSRGRGRALLPGTLGAGPRVAGRCRASAVRQGTGHSRGHFGARLLADRRRTHSPRRRRLARHLRRHRVSGGARPRLRP